MIDLLATFIATFLMELGQALALRVTLTPFP